MNCLCNVIEEEYVPAPHNVMVQIFRAHRWMAKSCWNMMQGLGYDMLSEADYAMITVLDAGKITIQELANRLSRPIEAVRNQVNRLETLGFIKIVRDQKNDNQKQIVFTDLGWQLISDMSNIVTQAEIVLCQRIGVSSLNKFRGILSSNWGPSLKESDLLHNEQIFYKKDSKLDL